MKSLFPTEGGGFFVPERERPERTGEGESRVFVRVGRGKEAREVSGQKEKGEGRVGEGQRWKERIEEWIEREVRKGASGKDAGEGEGRGGGNSEMPFASGLYRRIHKANRGARSVTATTKIQRFPLRGS